MNDGPVFRAGLAANGAQFRSTDVNEKPVDPGSETDTQRSERIRALQDMRMAQGPREIPSAEPAQIMREWFAASPDNRMSKFAQSLTENPEFMPRMEMEPGPGERPKPGGLYEKAAQRANRGSAV